MTLSDKRLRVTMQRGCVRLVVGDGCVRLVVEDLPTPLVVVMSPEDARLFARDLEDAAVAATLDDEETKAGRLADEGKTDNGSMSERHGQRLCENCVWDHDRGNFSCDCLAPDEKAEER